MNRRKMQSPLSAAEKRDLWGTDFAANEEEYLNEVETRWGDSEAYAQSARRVARYGSAEWKQINEDNAAIEARIGELMDAVVATAGLGAFATATATADTEHQNTWEKKYWQD